MILFVIVIPRYGRSAYSGIRPRKDVGVIVLVGRRNTVFMFVAGKRAVLVEGELP